MHKIKKTAVLLAAAAFAAAAPASRTTETAVPTLTVYAKSSESVEESAEETAGESSRIASGAERSAGREVGSAGMEEVTPERLNDGAWEITVDTDPSMFRVERCLLTKEADSLTAEVTLGGSGFSGLYMGTAEEAVAAEDAAEEAAGADGTQDADSSEEPAPVGDGRLDIEYTEDEQGRYIFNVPVDGLNRELPCAAISKKKQKWYDHIMVFLADELPEDAFVSGDKPALVHDGAASGSGDSLREKTKAGVVVIGKKTGKDGGKEARAEIPDGEYQVAVALEGGSGRASVESPCTVTVTGGSAAARIVWSSSSYDYMIVNGEKILPVSREEHSVFEIPVSTWDEPMEVTADTVAMSEPHEIRYTLEFESPD